MTTAGVNRRADIALVLVAVTWGGSYLAAQVLTKVASPVEVLALRFVPSVIVLLAIAAYRRSRITSTVMRIGLILGMFQAVTLTLETSAVTHTSATNAGVLVCLAVVIAPALEGVVSGQRLPGLYFAATAVSVIGVVLLLGPSSLTRPNVGDVMVIGAACTRATFMVCSGHLTRGKEFDAVALNVVQTAFNAIIFGVLAAATLPGTVSHFDGSHWAVVAFLSIGCTCAAFLLQLWAIHHTSATRASLLMGTEPVWALLAGVLLAGDHLEPLGIVGAVTIIAATIWGQRIEARWRKALVVPV